MLGIYACTKEFDGSDFNEEAASLSELTVVEMLIDAQTCLKRTWLRLGCGSICLRKRSGKGLDPGDFTPWWESATVSLNNETLSVEVEIDAANYYVAWPRNPEDEKLSNNGVFVLQKAHDVKDRNAAMGCYIMTVYF